MSASSENIERMRKFRKRFLDRDNELNEELADTGGGLDLEASLEAFETFTPEGAEPAGLGDEFNLESIIMRSGRPVLDVLNNETVLEFVEQSESKTWKARLENAADILEHAIKASGRINLQNHYLDWVGTGWLVARDIMVTNRHVAQEFTMRDGQGFTFATDGERSVRANIDFLKEFDNPGARVFKLIDVLDVIEYPDMAFFRVEQTAGDGPLSDPILLSSAPSETQLAAVIGYPANDSRIPDFTLMEDIYGKRYNHKRVAPGSVTFLEKDRLLHDATTLGGNSGSVVLNLKTGEAFGLHYSGAFMTTNYAVRSDIVKEALERVQRGDSSAYEAERRRQSSRSADGSSGAVSQPRLGGSDVVLQTPPQPVPGMGAQSVTFPLTVTVSLGAPGGADTTTYASAPLAPEPGLGQPSIPDTGDDDLIDENEEARPETYRNRKGFNAEFLGADKPTELPEVLLKKDLLTFEFDGAEMSELKYHNFSVVMNKPRRMCFFSAVNIDGAHAKMASRVGWKWDGRIPRTQQIMKECYGNPPKFSRGHMTRHNDPGWGAEADARLGNEDSMHVTNATPQMQAFNSPVWLELEDYALNNAIEDGMRVCVFTGPFFKNSDPLHFGVKVPVAFWKVIAFVHDRTGRLCATGYRMDQTANLPSQEEFVFGAFRSSHTHQAAQVSVRSIEEEAAIDFGGLADLDPLGQQESVGGRKQAVTLLSKTQIRYI
ncbi:DNA/RNA non-specific endonuclease [uncultured Roseibium sp.]|uniref:DNA/RNA non-specific endonuclease n=1 Tax=uncultured Roseibium sp. TaxID=1936171 RepID=UPI00263709DC|nr:DNA/RNA non-specific endonuclease [uncultured Roseibium sp.]